MCFADLVAKSGGTGLKKRAQVDVSARYPREDLS